MAAYSASKTVEELERELARQNQIVTILTEKWMRDRKITVRQVRELADEIQWHEDNSRIATIAGASTAIVGGGIAVAGAVSAFFTFGTSLSLTVVGGAISGVGGVTLVGTDIINGLLRSGKFKDVQRALEKDKDTTSELVKEVENLESILGERNRLIEQNRNVKVPKIVSNVGSTVYSSIQRGTKLAKAGSEAGETVFKSLGKMGKVSHVAGLAISTVFIAVDIYTLIQTSIDVHKGCKLEVVKDIHNIAQSLEDELEKPLIFRL